MKGACVVLVIVLLLVQLLISAVVLGSCQAEQVYCECMGRQVYINTKWYGECLINVTDYNDSDTTVLLFEAMEICR